MPKLEVELHKIIQHSQEGNLVIQEGRMEITDFLYSQSLRHDEWTKVLKPNFVEETGMARLPYLPPDWDWRINTQDKASPYRGKIAKRIEAYYRKVHGVKEFPASVAQRVGELAGMYAATSDTYYMDFTNNLNWKAGDFGDSGSCFWGGRNMARRVMQKNGVLAVRFYKSIEGQRGIARAWIVLNVPFEGAVIVYNGYSGERWGDATRVITTVLSSYFKLPFRDFIFRSKTEGTGGNVYINDNGRCFLIGEERSIKLWEHYEFDWKSKVIAQCHITSEDIIEGDDYLEVDFNGRRVFVMRQAWEERASTCPHCDMMDLKENFVDVHGITYCSNCIVNYCVKCSKCEQFELMGDMAWVEGEGMSVCPNCYDTVSFCCVSGLASFADNMVFLPSLVGIQLSQVDLSSDYVSSESADSTGHISSDTSDMVQANLLQAYPAPSALPASSVEILIKCGALPDRAFVENKNNDIFHVFEMMRKSINTETYKREFPNVFAYASAVFAPTQKYKLSHIGALVALHDEALYR